MQLADIQYKPTGLGTTDFSIKNSTIVFEPGKPNSYRSSLVRFAAKLKQENAAATDVSVRWSVAPHKDDNIVQCFDLGFNVKTGETRIRYEHQHPEYTDALAVGDIIGYPLSLDTFVGFEFIKLDNLENKTSSFELAQFWHGDRIRMLSYTDTEHFVQDYPNGCQIAIKPKENIDRVDIKDIEVLEIE